MTAIDEILEQEEQLANAKRALDPEAIDRIYGDDLLVTGALGEPTCSKNAVMDEIRRGIAQRENAKTGEAQLDTRTGNEETKVRVPTMANIRWNVVALVAFLLLAISTAAQQRYDGKSWRPTLRRSRVTEGKPVRPEALTWSAPRRTSSTNFENLASHQRAAADIRSRIDSPCWSLVRVARPQSVSPASV